MANNWINIYIHMVLCSCHAPLSESRRSVLSTLWSLIFSPTVVPIVFPVPVVGQRCLRRFRRRSDVSTWRRMPHTPPPSPLDSLDVMSSPAAAAARCFSDRSDAAVIAAIDDGVSVGWMMSGGLKTNKLHLNHTINRLSAFHICVQTISKTIRKDMRAMPTEGTRTEETTHWVSMNRGP